MRKSAQQERVIQTAQTHHSWSGTMAPSLGGSGMSTAAECRTRAAELTALAEREPEHRDQHLVDAAAWLVLARRTDEIEKQNPGNPG